MKNASSGILIFANSIHSNDKSASTSDGRQRHASTTRATTTAGRTTFRTTRSSPATTRVPAIVTATLNSDQALTTYTVQLYESGECDHFGHGEGETFLGAVNAVTSGSGNAAITMNAAVTPGWYLTMPASDPDGNTSEFSACYQVKATPIRFS